MLWVSLEVPHQGTSNEYPQHIMHIGKRPLCYMWRAKVLMSVHIFAVWSGHSLFINIYYNILWVCKRQQRFLICLCQWACMSRPELSTKDDLKGPFHALCIMFLWKKKKKYLLDTHSYLELCYPKYLNMVTLHHTYQKKSKTIEQVHLTNRLKSSDWIANCADFNKTAPWANWFGS